MSANPSFIEFLIASWPVWALCAFGALLMRKRPDQSPIPVSSESPVFGAVVTVNTFIRIVIVLAGAAVALAIIGRM